MFCVRFGQFLPAARADAADNNNTMAKNNRRNFLQKAGALTATAFFSSLAKPAWSQDLERAIRGAEGVPADDLAGEEDFWYYIQQSFTISPYLVNLNNGGVSPAPKTVQDAMKRYYDFSNEAPSYYMWRILDQGREPLRTHMAKMSGSTAIHLKVLRR